MEDCVKEDVEPNMVHSKLDAGIVSRIFLDCLIKENEFDVKTKKPSSPFYTVEGIVAFYMLSKDRVSSHRQEIIDALSELPKEFMKKNGGGWTFLNMCVDKNGRQWSGLHRVMEQLVVLGVAINKVTYCLPRQVWNKLPGGVPYIQIDL